MENPIDIVEDVFLGDLLFVSDMEILENGIREGGAAAVAVDEFTFLRLGNEFAGFRFFLFVEIEGKALAGPI